MKEKKRARDIAIIMSVNDGSREEAEELLKNGTEVFENPEEYIQRLKDYDIDEGLTVEQIKNGEMTPYLWIVEYENHEYLICYSFKEECADLEDDPELYQNPDTKVMWAKEAKNWIN